MYSLLNGTVMVFLDRNLFRTFLENNNGVTHRNCQSLFLSLEYDVYPTRSLMKWHFAPISNGFTVFSLIQDFILIVMLFICNTSVISGLNGMERRLRESCPRPSNDRRNAQDLMAMSGKEFSRLMIAINIVVVLLITPNMVCFL
jgi:heme/copper-type cytochrome/quinol oxidase subunit 1